MFLASLIDRGSTPALVHTLTFHEARVRMIAENIANGMTPNYRTKQLDVGAFQRALRESLEARGADPGRPMALSTSEVRTDAAGALRVRPSLQPVENVTSHDGTNLSIEREMANLAETGMAHELASQLLRRKFDGLRTAIRGTVA